MGKGDRKKLQNLKIQKVILMLYFEETKETKGS